MQWLSLFYDISIGRYWAMTNKSSLLSKEKILEKIAFFLILAFLTSSVIAQSLVLHQKNNEEQVTLQSMTLTPNSTNTYETHGRVNGKPVVFLIDTGASGLTFSVDTAQYISAPPCKGYYQSKTANGIINTCNTKVNELTFGPFLLKNIPANVVPNMEKGLILLGMNVLQNFNVSINNGRMKLEANLAYLVNPNYRPKIKWFEPREGQKSTHLYLFKKIAGVAFILILIIYAVIGLFKIFKE